MIGYILLKIYSYIVLSYNIWGMVILVNGIVTFLININFMLILCVLMWLSDAADGY